MQLRSWKIGLGGISVAALVIFFASRGHRESEPEIAPRAESSEPTSLALSPSEARRAQFVGSASCTLCHEEQAKAYTSSHHALALAVPERAEVDARFDGSSFTTKHGGATQFLQEEGSPRVSGPGADGSASSFAVPYVSGVWPLKQYVVDAGRGKLQSFGVAWDERAETQDGKRWFHLYGPEGIAPGDRLFFTAPAQNWNHMCADCHSMFVERRYDVDADRFDTKWSELSVGCEACHGPGAEHVKSARDNPGKAPVAFAVSLQRSEPWVRAESGSPSPHKQDGVEVNTCAPCHSLREPIQEAFFAHEAFLDFFSPELLTPPHYHGDGQVRGEVYEWGSFLQSRMYQAGVRCSDCHEPHSGKTRAEGNSLCVSCHDAERFDAPQHSHHQGKNAPACIDCHMPPATFMQVDERRDHSIRIPRPDLSVSFGTPNACNGCHTKESATWARDRALSFYPGLRARKQATEALLLHAQGAVEAPKALRALALDEGSPEIVRATALERLGRYPSEKTTQTFRQVLGRGRPLLTYGAVLGAAQLPLTERAQLLLPILKRAERASRVAIGKALASVPLARLPKDERRALEEAFHEVEEALHVSSSRAETHVERSAFELARGRFDEARRALEIALRIEPCLTEAYLNLAELERQRKNEAASGAALHEALKCNPSSASAAHALGLWQVRNGQGTAALESLEKAVRAAPNDARFGYVYAVALSGQGKRQEAIRVLEGVLKEHPNDQSALGALMGLLPDKTTPRAEEARARLAALRD
jgi:predicted CXXCH cytochrome family protein